MTPTQAQIVGPTEVEALEEHQAMLARIAEERAEMKERCAQVADDWFTLAPKYRTKENLLARIRALKE